MSAKVRCADVAPLLVFYACDEVSPEERKQIEAHLGMCSACATQLDEEQEMQAAFGNAAQAADELDPTGSLLAQCRSEFAEKLDDLAAPPIRGHWLPFGTFRRWMTLHPAWSAAVLVAMGIAAGVPAARWISPVNGAEAGGAQTVNVRPVSRLTDEDLAKMAVAGVTFTPAGASSGSGNLQLQVRTEQPLVLNGNLDDADVRRVLTYVVANGERFDPGVRLDCLDALKARTGDAEVRNALLTAARRDQNAAVRMKALEALRNSGDDVGVRDTLLEALQHDANPGVRVEAVNLLVRSLEGNAGDDAQDGGTVVGPEVFPVPGQTDGVPADPSVERVVRALEELQRRDPNRYVRLRSAAALRQIGSHDLQ